MASIAEAGFVTSGGVGLKFVRRLFREKPLGAIGGVVFVLFLLCGAFADVPYDTIMAAFRSHYPALMTRHGLAGDFQTEAVAGEAARQDA